MTKSANASEDSAAAALLMHLTARGYDVTDDWWLTSALTRPALMIQLLRHGVRTVAQLVHFTCRPSQRVGCNLDEGVVEALHEELVALAGLASEAPAPPPRPRVATTPPKRNRNRVPRLQVSATTADACLAQVAAHLPADGTPRGARLVIAELTPQLGRVMLERLSERAGPNRLDALVRDRGAAFGLEADHSLLARTVQPARRRTLLQQVILEVLATYPGATLPEVHDTLLLEHGYDDGRVHVEHHLMMLLHDGAAWRSDDQWTLTDE